jgi:hypothetical protein
MGEQRVERHWELRIMESVAYLGDRSELFSLAGPNPQMRSSPPPPFLSLISHGVQPWSSAQLTTTDLASNPRKTGTSASTELDLSIDRSGFTYGASHRHPIG